MPAQHRVNSRYANGHSVSGHYVNSVATRSGTVRAVCECCGKQSRPVHPDADGEPSVMKLACGWSEAPYPPDLVHADGSRGSNFLCPSCNGKLKQGQRLKLRNYNA